MLRRILSSLTGRQKKTPIDIVPAIPIALDARPEGDHVPTCSIREFPKGPTEVIAVESGSSLFVSNWPGRSLAFEIPGVWGWGNDQGAIRSVDGSEMAGVLLLSGRDLAEFAGATLVDQAATFN